MAPTQPTVIIAVVDKKIANLRGDDTAIAVSPSWAAIRLLPAGVALWHSPAENFRIRIMNGFYSIKSNTYLYYYHSYNTR